jgi:hypothetical protein
LGDFDERRFAYEIDNRGHEAVFHHEPSHSTNAVVSNSSHSLSNETQEWPVSIWPIRSEASPAGLRGSPIRAGWNNAAEVSVQTSDNANSLPMLDIPG